MPKALPGSKRSYSTTQLLIIKERIQTLDGLRFLAAAGVLWIHAWTSSGNPRFYIGRFDIADLLALGGNGVDLFFVISGFCMYYFYASKIDFSYRDFYRFLIKRWIRLSPAFYAATVIYFIHNFFFGAFNNNYIIGLFVSTLYLNSIFQQYNIAAHFWTLGVEWQFYAIIPLLLIYQNKYGFKKTFIGIWGLLFATAIALVLYLKNQSDLMTYQLFFRGIEFGFGILAARLLFINFTGLKKRALWLITFIIITYAGRILISNPVLRLSAGYYNLFKLAGFSLLGFGFSGILYCSVTSQSKLRFILGNRIFKTMGKISYSFYLWHGLVLPIVIYFVAAYFPFLKGILRPAVVTIISVGVLYPVSLLSYNLLEKPFLLIGNLNNK